MAASKRSLDILDIPAPKADSRIAYGSDPLQFADLRSPVGSGRGLTVIYIHGGFWKAAYNLDHAGHVCAALTHAGAVTWNLEYRRIGNPGGGWPGTCDDIQQAARFIAARTKDPIVVAGHSAGGHLALWLAAQKAIKLRGAVSLAGVADLRLAWDRKLSDGIVGTFLGGSPEEVPDRYKAADPMALLPIAVKQRLVHGTEDDIVPFEISERFAKASRNAQLIPVRGAGHFELVDPRTEEWKVVEKAILWTSD